MSEIKKNNYVTFASGWKRVNSNNGKTFISGSAENKKNNVKLLVQLPNGQTFHVNSFTANLVDKEEGQEKHPDMYFSFDVTSEKNTQL